MDLDPVLVRAVFHRLAARDFATFVRGAFAALHDEKFLPNWHIHAICHELETVRSGHCRRQIISMPPRTMKSWIGSVCWPAWLLGHNPGEKIVCASYSQDLAATFAFDTRRLIQNAFYKRVFPATILDSRKQSTDELRTTRGGYRLSTSVGGTLTGRGGNYIIIDDPLKAKDGQSEVAREAACEWYRNTVTSRLNNPRTGRIVVIAQRLHPEDLTGYLLSTGSWSELRLPLVAERDEEIEISHGCVARRPAGAILHDDRFSKQDVERLRNEMGERDFEAQYNQRPLPPGGALFQLQWLKRYDVAPQKHEVEAIIQSWDTAYETDGHNDYSVCSTWALSGKRHFLLDIFRARLQFPELQKAVFDQRAKWKADIVIVEKAGSGISLSQNIRQQGKLWIVTLSPLGSKQDRASQQSPKFERGEVWVPRDALWLAAFEDELARFPHSKHDDQVDSVVQFLGAVDKGQLHVLINNARRL